MADLRTLLGDRLVLRPISPDDRAALRAILAEPAVARWWGPDGPDRAVGELFGPDAETGFTIVRAGSTIGWIGFAEELDPDYRHAGLDIFLTSTEHGRGLGQEALRLVARYLIDERGHHRLTIDPAADNLVAIRTYTAVGFRPVGVLRRYERGFDGTWHDGLLMDLLAEELRRT